MRSLRLLVCMSLITGCAAMTRVESGSGSQLTVEGRTYEEVWQAALKVVARHLTIRVGTDKGRGEIQAESPVGILSQGEMVGVFITPPNTPSNRYAVEVVSRKRVSLPLAGKSWEQSIIDELKTELKL